MGVINVLSFEVANLIAAGEVVDRPASAIKEMIENSIDAGAKHITVEIQNGGITFMRISDDGCGMDATDLPLAIKRHATSKIKNAEDLDGICTLGFRGEALAAISAVSRLRIISKTRGSTMGAELVVDCGEQISLSERGCSDGTTIIVEDLFANVPARRKFLKRDVTETTAVCANVEKIALSHPEIAFRLITDGQIRLETAGDGKLFSAIYAVFGRDFSNRLIEVDGEFDGISVKGFVGRSDNVKSNRNYENFYINKRFVKSRTASAAIEQAFVSYMPSEKFPVCVLFISLHPGRVDVNVHPAKLEVKFSNEKPVFEAIYYAVRQALEQNTARPEIEMPKGNSGGVRMSEAFIPVEREKSLKSRQISIETQGTIKSDVAIRGDYKPSVTVQTQVKPSVAQAAVHEAAAIKQSEKPTFVKITAEQYVREIMQYDDAPTNTEETTMPLPKSEADDVKVKDDVKKPEDTHGAPKMLSRVDGEVPASVPMEAESSQAPEPVKIEYRIVGEVFNSYILVELSEKMLIIDKHAAHERIIFEQLKKNMYSQKVSSQLLMLPIDVMLMSDEVSVIEEYRGELEAVGFEFSCSRNTVSVMAIPVGIEQEAVGDMFAVVADRIKNGTGKVELTRNIIFEKALYQASCKAAIKAGREYAKGHGEWLVEKLMELPDITFCPHGRPVAMEMSKKNIDRQFERT
ncbi:MAG: DNA mismatch repair endonuclease MutL [Clostridia bacterium]|nr:DNA mismatch repair endonuclease MutL [Clostridia bacterium]